MALKKRKPTLEYIFKKTLESVKEVGLDMIKKGHIMPDAIKQIHEACFYIDKGISQSSESVKSVPSPVFNEDINVFIHSRCCGAHWELIQKKDGSWDAVCEKCHTPAGSSIKIYGPPAQCECEECKKEKLLEN